MIRYRAGLRGVRDAETEQWQPGRSYSAHKPPPWVVHLAAGVTEDAVLADSAIADIVGHACRIKPKTLGSNDNANSAISATAKAVALLRYAHLQQHMGYVHEYLRQLAQSRAVQL